MSKSLGNVVLADDAHRELGSDLLRLYVCADVAPWETQKFSMKSAKELGRVLNVFWNTYLFMQTYGDKNSTALKNLRVEDEWIVSRVNSLIDGVTQQLEKFEIHLAARALNDFILNDFSRMYIKLIRDRVSPWYDGKDKTAAQATMNYVMERLVKLMAPFTPFVAEKVHSETAGASVHLAEWPKSDRKFIDTKLEGRMIATAQAVEALQALRQAEGIKLRWPMDAVEVPEPEKLVKEVVMELANAVDVRKGKALKLGKPDMELALLRELTRKVQSMRKEAGMKFHEAIALELDADEKTALTLKKKEAELSSGVGAEKVAFKKLAKPADSLEFEGSKIGISFRKA